MEIDLTSPNTSQQPAPAPQDPTPRRRRWRQLGGGAVAGALLAASITVPVTLGIARAVAPDPAPTIISDAGPATTQQVLPTPGTTDGSGGTDSSGSTGVTPYGGPGTAGRSFGGQFAGGSAQEGSTASPETDASTAQSQGVVLIDTVLPDGEAAGTGLVLESDGLVVTNYHVVAGSSSVQVTIATTGETYAATVVGHDAAADVALLQLQDASGLTPITIDAGGDPVVTDAITAIGNAEGQGYLSAASGTVEALGQSITTEATTATDGESLTDLIQTDAAVVGGYSGGALLDAQGEVVGMTTAASSGGVAESYAVPIQDALAVVARIEAGTETATTRIGSAAYLGVSIGQDLNMGSVADGSPAADAGLGAGSTITALDATPVTTYDGLAAVLAQHEPGDRIAIAWTDADGAAHRATLTLGSSPLN